MCVAYEYFGHVIHNALRTGELNNVCPRSDSLRMSYDSACPNHLGLVESRHVEEF